MATSRVDNEITILKKIKENYHIESEGWASNQIIIIIIVILIIFPLELKPWTLKIDNQCDP